MIKKIKIGQIGISHEHAPGTMTDLKKLPDIFEIVVVVDDRDSKSAKYPGLDMSMYDGLTWMGEEELFNVPGLQAVAVETPNLDLVPTALRCMEHNLAIHMDKPGGDDLELFARLRKGCEERNLPFQIGYMFRGNPAMQWCFKAVRQGWLGDVFEIQANMSHNYGTTDYLQYLGAFKGGIIFNLGCHFIDLSVAMLGRPVHVTPFLQSTSGVDAKIKNNCLAVLEYPHTIVRVHACSQEVNGQGERRLKICGTKGTIDLSPTERFDGHPLQAKLMLNESNEQYDVGTHFIDFEVKLDRHKDQLHDFAKMINGEIKNPYTYEHDYLAQEVLLAAAGYTTWKI